ncbi:maleate cis-trans isomerase family protein [Arthrobacter ginkgonis]
MTAAMLADWPEIGVHYSRFRLPPNLDDAIDLDVLGDAPLLLGDAEVDALAFHGTSGSWTGLAGDRRLCAALTQATGAPATTASLAVLAALQEFSLTRIAVVFPGPADIVSLIQREYAGHGIDLVHRSVPAAVMSNPQIARLSRAEIGALMRPAFGGDVEAVVCVGTNLRSGYLAAEFEAEFGVPVIDSATATLWHLLRIAGASGPIPGWGRLLAAS